MTIELPNFKDQRQSCSSCFIGRAVVILQQLYIHEQEQDRNNKQKINIAVNKTPLTSNEIYLTRLNPFQDQGTVLTPPEATGGPGNLRQRANLHASYTYCHQGDFSNTWLSESWYLEYDRSQEAACS